MTGSFNFLKNLKQVQKGSDVLKKAKAKSEQIEKKGDKVGLSL